MGHLPTGTGAVQVAVLEEVDCGDYLRQSIQYWRNPREKVPAYLLKPKNFQQGFGILCLHQTHSAGNKVVVGLGNSPNDEYAVELVKLGYVCLAPSYPQLAGYEPKLEVLGYASGTMKAIADNRMGLDLLETIPGVHNGKFASIGHSLGGHNGLFTAAFDERIKVVITSCGFDSFKDYMNGDIRGWTSSRYMPRLKTMKPPPFDFDDVLCAISPRAVFVSAPKGDTNFKWASVDRMVTAARRSCGASEIIVHHPEAGHLFPENLRHESYNFLRDQLQKR